MLSNSLLKINLHYKFLLYSNIVLLRWWRCLNLLLNHPLYFFHLGSAPECEVRLTDSRKIIMKLYVFLVNTGTTLTFDTELTVQTWVVFHFSLVFHPKFIPYFKKISYCDGGRHSQWERLPCKHNMTLMPRAHIGRSVVMVCGYHSFGRSLGLTG